MSTDPTQPAPSADDQPTQPAPPTVQSPTASSWGQEGVTQAAPQWAPPPPPPPPPAKPSFTPAPGIAKQDSPAPAQPAQAPPADQQAGPAQPAGPAQGPGAGQRQDAPTARWTPQETPTEQWTPQDTPQAAAAAAAPAAWPPAPQSQPQDSPPQQWGQQPGQQWSPQQPGQQWSPQQPGQQWSPQQPPQQPPLRFGKNRRRRRVRRSFMAVFTIIVLLILLVIGDRVANAIAENEMASQFVSNGFPVKPSVSIEGFPFLTQLAAKDFKTVNISAGNVPAGPVTITSVHATINGMHISSLSSNASAKVDHVTATAFISFGALAAAGSLGGSNLITVTQDGPNKLKISVGVGGVLSDTEEASVTQTGPQTISIKVLNNGGGIGSLLPSSFSSFSFTLPKGVPASLRITSIVVNSQGLTLSAAASNATFSK
ncbi:MAG TPA: LmeA family phospholipid-binding protein [Trebonia sp.]|nr:LmeA family phospholipid-binding protein [Trebonia sp.]